MARDKDDIPAPSSERVALPDLLVHEMRAPLAYISAAAELLETGHPALDEAAIMGRTVRQRCQQLTALLDELLLAYGPGPTPQAPYALTPVLEDMVRFIQWGHPNTTITLQTPENLHCVTNQAILAAILRNLLDNAARVSVDGDVEINVTVNDTRAAVSVTDSGPGLSERAVGIINGTLSYTTPKGSEARHGLGLFICRQLADLGGCPLYAAAAQGKGQVTLEVRLAIPS